MTKSFKIEWVDDTGGVHTAEYRFMDGERDNVLEAVMQHVDELRQGSQGVANEEKISSGIGVLEEDSQAPYLSDIAAPWLREIVEEDNIPILSVRDIHPKALEMFLSGLNVADEDIVQILEEFRKQRPDIGRRGKLGSLGIAHTDNCSFVTRGRPCNCGAEPEAPKANRGIHTMACAFRVFGKPCDCIASQKVNTEHRSW